MNPILQDLLAVQNGIGLCWLGNLGWLIHADGKLFQPGDTVLPQEHLEGLAGVNVVFVSPTLHNTHIAASKTLIETIRPEFVFPQHFGTYRPTDQNSYWTVGYPDELCAALSPGMQHRFHKLDQGQSFLIAP
ncbi:MAG: hypothetical protein HY332_09870 [Chloroflexi bacterium]|nr:hypothetical protein [Chloroflexota bacterium]